MSKLKVLVTGVTGKQGGAVARRLLARGHTVRGLTRNEGSDAAKEIAKAGVELRHGDLVDRASIDAALQGVDAVFSMTTPFEKGMEIETRQGVTVADAAKAANVFLVYTSVGGADRNTGIPHFDSKYEVEKHIRSIGAASTILAPVYFMENAKFTRDQIAQGVFATPITADRKLAQIAVGDIAACAVSVLENRAKHEGKRYDIGGDELSGNEAVAILSKVKGKPFKYFQVPMDMIRQRMGDDGAKMYEWFERVGYTLDLAALRRDFPDVEWHTFEAWAREQTWF
jgi:uncharacterized protein YbjT (DUF2867 family)